MCLNMYKDAAAFLRLRSHFLFGFTAVELLMYDALRSDGEEWYSFLYLLPEERRKEKKDVIFNSEAYINCHQLFKTKIRL